MNNVELKNKARSYTQQVLLLECLLLGGIHLSGMVSWQVSLVCAAYTLIFYIADAWAWYWVASRHRDYLTSFFTGTSGTRFLLALAVIGGFYLFAGGDMKVFLVVFFLYYLVMLIHHSIFFLRVSNCL